MAKSLPPLTWFRAFEAAARKLSFTAAAQEIGMTQSAVSQHVKSLETRLGVALFTRKPRGLSLTDDGRKLLPQVDAALEALSAATRAFDTGTPENVLTIATSVSAAQWLIAPRLSEFTQQNPDIRIRFLSTIWPDDFHSVRADIEIPFASRNQVGAHAVLLEPNRLIALKSPSLVGGLSDLPLIEAVGTSDGWQTWRDDVGGVGAPSVYVDSYGAALNFAVHGNGVALVSEVIAQHALAAGVLVRAHVASLACSEGYYLDIQSKSQTATRFETWLHAGISAAT